MSASQPGAFRRAMEAKRSSIASRIADETREAGLVHKDMQAAELLSAVNANLELWFDMMEGEGSSRLEAATAAWCTRIRGRVTSAGTVLKLIERTAELLFDAAIEVLDEGVEGAEEGTKVILRGLLAATTAYDGAFRASYEAAARRALILRDVAENSPDGIGVAKPNGEFTYVNPALLKMFDRDEAEVNGANITDFMPPGQQTVLAYETAGGALTSTQEGTRAFVRRDGSTFNTHVTAFWVLSAQGEAVTRCAFLRDLTDEERAQEERRTLERQIVEAQEEALRELATPLLPLAEGVLAMPIVGTIDQARATRFIEEMLSGITRMDAGHVLVDITGVPVVTAEVAEMITRAARAAELVGAEVVLTGIRGAVAKTLLELGVDLGTVETQSTLRAGVAHAIAHERSKRRAERRRLS